MGQNMSKLIKNGPKNFLSRVLFPSTTPFGTDNQLLKIPLALGTHKDYNMCPTKLSKWHKSLNHHMFMQTHPDIPRKY